MTLASIRRLLASGRCAWMLAWALCLPLAQWATAAHELQHLRTPAAEEREKPAQAPVACGICLAASAIGGGAPLPAVHAHAAILLPQPAPTFHPIAQHRPPAPRFYASRAPPLLHA
jgi:hypothetical protein